MNSISYCNFVVVVDNHLLLFPGDNCSSLNVRSCIPYGYGRVTTPSITGLDSVYYMQSYLNTIERYLNDSSDMCHQHLMELACGLHSTRCSHGDALPGVCREDCQGTTSLLLTLTSKFQ